MFQKIESSYKSFFLLAILGFSSFSSLNADITTNPSSNLYSPNNPTNIINPVAPYNPVNPSYPTNPYSTSSGAYANYRPSYTQPYSSSSIQMQSPMNPSIGSGSYSSSYSNPYSSTRGYYNAPTYTYDVYNNPSYSNPTYSGSSSNRYQVNPYHTSMPQSSSYYQR